MNKGEPNKMDAPWTSHSASGHVAKGTRPSSTWPNYIKSRQIDWKTLEENYIPSSNEEITFHYNPFAIKQIQNYNPTYNEFFVLNENNYDKISLNHRYHFNNTTSVYDTENNTIVDRNIFIKYSPLLDPYRYMTGKYKTLEDLDKLPTFVSTTSSLNSKKHKLSDYNNASYVDNFFCYLASMFMHKHRFVHGVDYYGSFLAIQNVFKVNVVDDYEYLQSSDYFLENNGRLFSVVSSESDTTRLGSRANKMKLRISNEIKHNVTVYSLGEVGDVGGDPCEVEEVYEKKSSPSTSLSTSSSSSSSSSDSEDDSSVSEDIHAHEDDDDQWETESDSSSIETDMEEEEPRNAYINNFPVQFICLEKCDGTLDELFVKKEMDETKAASVFFQVIMTLIAYQKAFHFTHNDLHTNNIMFSNTDKEFLWYRYRNVMYKVPTYGKIFKIIDFGRSIYRFNNRLFCSDSFAVGGDASTQYNTEPYLNENKPRLDPNYSFDLCRLGCSIYDFIIDDDSNESVAGFNELQKTVYRWCTDDKGRNVLYKRSGEERYPGFKLYKMIAKTVHRHTPEEQLKYGWMKQFRVSEVGCSGDDLDVVMDLDGVGRY